MKILWRRSPLLLLRFPVLAAAVALVAAIASISAVTGPLFLASTEVGSLREGIRQATQWTAGYTATFPSEIPAFNRSTNEADVREYLADLRDLEKTIERRWSDIPNVEGPFLGAAGSGFDLETGTDEVRARMLFREQALDHVEMIETSGTEGLFIPDVTAEALDVSAGDDVFIEASDGERNVRVAGVYRYLTTQPPTSFWSPYDELIYREPGTDTDPPALVLVTRPVYEELMLDLRDLGGVRFNAPLNAEELGIEDARETLAHFERESAVLSNEYFPGFTPASPQTALSGIVGTAEERISTVTPVVDMLSGAASIIALAVAAAAGFFLVKRRRTEVRTLAARGIGPVAQGVRYGVESILPALAGAGVGVVSGFFLVSLLGPAERLQFDELEAAWLPVTVTVALAIVILTTAASFAAWREEVNIAAAPAGVHHGRSSIIALVVAGSLGALAYLMRSQVSAEDVADPRLTIAPVLLLGAGSLIASVLILEALPSLTGPLRFRAPSLYLATRRLTGASGMTRVLIVAGAWALGIGVYGFTASSSVETTAEAKAKVFVGSDFSALTATTPDLSQVDALATHVTRIDHVTLTNGIEVGGLAIEPETFEQAAFWEPSFSDSSLAGLISSLEPEDDTIRVLATANLGNEVALQYGAQEIPLEVTETVSSFPGMPSDKPMIVMTRHDLTDTLRGLGSAAKDEEIWIAGEDDPESVLREAGVGYGRPLFAARALETPGLTALRWMLGLLAALGAAAAVISVAGLLLYLQARQRTALVSSALTRRMGLSGRREFVSWLSEIAGALILAFMVALAVGLPVSIFMLDRLDPKPNLYPLPIFVTPVVMLAVLAGVLTLLALGAAWRVKRSADTADIAQVMRV